MGGTLKNELGALASGPARLSARARGGLRDPLMEEEPEIQGQPYDTRYPGSGRDEQPKL